MQEHQVTIGGVSHRVPEPFLVLATQNPIESEGTYPLPEAQTDRFLFKVLVGYPSTGRGGRRRRPLARCRRRRARGALARPPRASPRRRRDRDRRPRGHRLRRRARRRDAQPRRPRPGGARAADRLRRLAARADRARPRRPGARAAARPRPRDPRTTSRPSRSTCCATGSCWATRRSPTASAPTTSWRACSRPSPRRRSTSRGATRMPTA